MVFSSQKDVIRINNDINNKRAKSKVKLKNRKDEKSVIQKFVRY